MSERDDDAMDSHEAAAIVSSADDAILGKDLVGIIQSWNRGAERIFGYSAVEAVGQPIMMLVPAQRQSEEAEILAKIRRGEQVEHYETVRVTREGRAIDVSLTTSSIRDDAGAIVGASEIVRDVTRRRRIDETRALLAAIVDSSDDAIVSKNLQGIINSWNRAAERIFGYTALEAVGQSITMLIPSERQSEEVEILAKITRGEQVDHYETVRVTRDGRLIDVSLTISPVRDSTGTIIGASKIARDITERRRAERVRVRLAAIVESAEDAIVTKTPEGIIDSWNRSAERIFGYSEAEALGRSIRMLIPAELQAEEDMILNRIRRGERVEQYETVRITQDGKKLDVSLTISPLRDHLGAVVGAAKIARDVTMQRRTERALAAQREWFRVTLASIGEAVIASDVDGRVTFQNSLAEKLTGWMNEEAIGRPLSEVFRILSEKTREPIENPAEKVIRSGAILGLANHTALVHRDGTERPIADSAAPIFDDDGKIIGVVLTFRDISAERLAEEAVHEQREWFEQTLQGIGDGVIATDIRGQIVFMNPVAEYLTGWKLSDCIGFDCRRVFNIVNEHSRQPVENPVGRVLQEGQIIGLANHTVLINADGTERFIDDSGAPIRNLSGRLVGAVLVFRDVTERRRAELERAAATHERERLLESERAARSDAERANRLKDEFVATLSHELRTPLNAILGWTQILREQPPRLDLVERGMDVIERNTRVQAQLVADLLDMSRIVAGKLTLDLHNADLASIIEAAIETVQPAAQGKGIALHVQVERAIGPVVGDPGRLQQVVWNLLSNAIKFTPSGGRIDVLLEAGDREALITVRDTGIGIQPQFLPLIFARFSQADSALNRRFGGLGLGLAIVKQLVELHGGTVEARSDGEGQGSTFCVRLPMSDLRLRKNLEFHPASSESPERRLNQEAELSGFRILVVEDDPDTADLVRRFLEGSGAEVTIAASADAALELLPGLRPQVLVSDVGMPGIDGYELIRRVRALEMSEGGATPAVAVTAFARAEDRSRALDAGFQAHLAKPIERVELISMVRMLSRLTLAAPRNP